MKCTKHTRKGLKSLARNKKASGGAMFGGTRRWLAAGTLAAYAVVGSGRQALAAVKETAVTGASGGDATLPLKRFDIPAGPLDAAIKAYEKTTGLTVKIVLPSGTIAGFTSHGVTGLYREDEALRQLLDGTGLNYRVEDATTMVVGVQAKDVVSVMAAEANAVAMGKFTEPLIDTPQSISVVPQFAMKDEGVSTLRDTLRNVPGI